MVEVASSRCPMVRAACSNSRSASVTSAAKGAVTWPAVSQRSRMSTASCAGASAEGERSRCAGSDLVAIRARANAHREVAKASSVSGVRSRAAVRSAATWRSMALRSIATFKLP